MRQLQSYGTRRMYKMERKICSKQQHAQCIHTYCTPKMNDNHDDDDDDKLTKQDEKKAHTTKNNQTNFFLSV